MNEELMLGACVRVTVEDVASCLRLLPTLRLSLDGGFDWDQSSDEVIREFKQMFNVTFGDVLRAAWRDYADLHRHKEADGEVALDEHTIESTHHPWLDIRVNGLAAKRVRFDLVFALKIAVARVSVARGRIEKLLGGEVSGEASLAPSASPELRVTREIARFPLPGSVSLGDGIPIP